MNAQNYPAWYTPFTCATPTAKASSRSTSCSATTPYFTSNAKNIPASNAERIKIGIDFYLFSKTDGTGGFDLQDSEDKKFLEDFVGMANWRINDLDPGLCSSTLPFMRSAKIELVPRFFEVHNTQYWDCPSDFSSCPFSGAGFYLKNFVDSLNDFSGCTKTIPILVPCESEGWEQFLGESIGKSDPNCCYGSFWCAELPTSDPAHIKDPLSSVLRNLYLKYSKFRNGILFQGAQHDWKETRQWLLDGGIVLAHEVFHNFDLLDQYTCKNDIMNNNGNADKRTLYPIDIGKMHRALAVTNARQFADVYQNYNVDRVVTTNETWDADMRIYQNVVVKPGATLTVKCTLRLGKNVSISVERGAKLLVDGGFLTNALDCQEEDWQGIYVWGDSNMEQPDPTGGPIAGRAGIVEVKNKAIIEHAVTAISTRAPFLSWADQQRHWGGVIRVHESTLRNNKRDVEFMSYKFSNKSSFTNSTFTEIGDWRDNTDGITIWDCNNITINNCTFDNLDRYGIIGIDYFGKIEKENHFKNIKDHAILDIATVPLSSGKSLTVHGNNFDSNLADVEIDGLVAMIARNSFNHSQFGAVIDGVNHHTIEFNDFRDEEDGISVISTQTSRGLAKCNWFHSGVHGITYWAKNSESRFITNDFQTSAFAVGLSNIGTVKGQVLNSISDFQGGAAANCFYDTNNIDIFTRPNETIAFSYIDHFLDPNRCELPQGNLTFPTSGIPNNYTVVKGDKSTVFCEVVTLTNRVNDIPEGYEDEFNIGSKIENGEYNTARQLLSQYTTETPERQEFKDIQMINLARLESQVEFFLTIGQENRLREIAISYSPMAIYARALLLLLKDELLKPQTPSMGTASGRSILHDRQAGLKPSIPISIAPNPSNGFFKIRFENFPIKNATFSLTDMYGREVFSNVINSFGYDDVFIDATGINDGIYYAKIGNGQRIFWETKIVIQTK